MKSIKLIFFFLKNFFDFKFDFPLPPKFILRIFDYTFWGTFFIQYYQRKNEKGLKKTKSAKANYYDWLYKTFNVQYNTIVNEKYFKIISTDSNKVLEGGIGSGSACACFLSFFLENGKKKNTISWN